MVKEDVCRTIAVCRPSPCTRLFFAVVQPSGGISRHVFIGGPPLALASQSTGRGLAVLTGWFMPPPLGVAPTAADIYISMQTFRETIFGEFGAVFL